MSYTRAEYEREMLAEQDERAPVLTWSQFRSQFDWKQGEHVGIIGPTGSGKTTMTITLLEMRHYVVAFATKPVDETIEKLCKSGIGRKRFVRWERWADRPASIYPRRVIWPKSRELYSQARQQKEFQRALEHVYVQGNWCVFIDELWYLINILKMQEEVKIYLLQARSNGISLVCCSQRPAWVPVELFDQSSHLFFYRDNDERNLKTIAGISWLSAKLVQSLVARLGQYQFLYVNTRTGEMYRSTAPPPPGEAG